ncbi:MAG: tetratricopeptide repeat protein [Halobacteriota archaeon]|jgi:Flp pilus assembly protein TadD
MTDTKFCKSCGTTPSSSARFCRECGAVLAEEPGVDQSASTAKEQVNEGIALYQQGDYQGALGKFGKATEADPTLAAAWSDKGCALGRLGERDAALEAFNKALEIDPDNREAREGKDLCLRMLGSSKEAS